MDTKPEVTEAQGDGLDWAARVQRLEAENAGLRRAMRTRAVIEQAKGLLSGIVGCGTDEAFEHLVWLSQQENRRVADVAARLLAGALDQELEDDHARADSVDPIEAPPFDASRYLRVTAPDAPAGGHGKDTHSATARADLAELSMEDQAKLQTATGSLQAAQTSAELAERLLSDGLAATGASAVVLVVSEPDGALRMVGYAGMDAQVASNWQRIPSQVDTMLGRAVSLNQAVWRPGTHDDAFVILRRGEAKAALPLRHGGRPYGSVGILWPGPHEASDSERAYIGALVGVVGRRLRRLAASDPAAPAHWLQTALDIVPAATMLLAPVRDDTGKIVDFVIDYASPESGHPYEQDPADLVGQRLLDVRPMLAVHGVFDAYVQVLSTGIPWRRATEPETVVVKGTTRRQALISRAATRVGDGVLATYQVHDEQARLARMAEMEEIGRLGYVVWNLALDTAHWSPGVYRIFERNQSRGPLALDKLPEYVISEDVPRLYKDIRTMLAERLPVDMQFRIRVRKGLRNIRALVRPKLDGQGQVVALHGVVQDVTDLHLRADLLRRTAQASAMRRVHQGTTPR
ncbi:MAG TPA: ANTAR domain-containing protein [Micromonosporaceae bacterium]